MAVNPYSWASPFGGQVQQSAHQQWQAMQAANSYAPQYSRSSQMGGMSGDVQTSSAGGTSRVGRERDDYGTAQYPPGSWNPQSNSKFMDTWYNKYGPGGPIDWSKSDQREIAERFTNDFATPFFNASMAERTQGFNEFANSRDFGEQQFINRHGMGLADRASGREDRALDFSMSTNNRDFREGVRQADRGFGEDQRQFDVTAGNNRFGLDTDRIGVNNQFTLGQGQQANERRGQDITRDLGFAGINQDRYNTDARSKVDMRGHDITQQLGLGQLSNDKARIGNDFTLGQGQLQNQKFANRTGRMDVKNQFALGQGQLGFQNRELDTNEAFRRSQLGQEADLTREKFQNDLKQTRYSTFGHANAPNFRAAQSWY